MRTRLSNVTFTLNDKPSQTLYNQLTWCNKVPKGKRNKPAKINGVQHHEVARDARSEISTSVGDDFVAIEHQYYVPVQ